MKNTIVMMFMEMRKMCFVMAFFPCCVGTHFLRRMMAMMFVEELTNRKSYFQHTEKQAESKETFMYLSEFQNLIFLYCLKLHLCIFQGFENGSAPISHVQKFYFLVLQQIIADIFQ